MRFTIERRDQKETAEIEPNLLVIAGWTGRDAAALEAHIEELEAMGVARPKAVPMFYRAGASLLTQADRISLVGRDGSGEVEAVLWRHEGALYVGLGSDHTDRVLEAVGVTLSKQVCPKPVSATLWPWVDVSEHWEELILRSTIDGGEVYQEGSTALLRRPDELWRLYEERHGALGDGAAMFCGTLPAQGGIRFAETMDLSLEDRRLGRSLQHRYSVEALPIAEAG